MWLNPPPRALWQGWNRRIGIKPTGKRLVFTGVDIDKVIDGLIVEHGGAVNTFETLFEAGMIGAI